MNIDELIEKLQQIRKTTKNVKVLFGDSYDKKTYKLYVEKVYDCELGDLVIFHDGTFHYEGVIV